MQNYPCINNRNAGVIAAVQQRPGVVVQADDSAPGQAFVRFVHAAIAGDTRELMTQACRSLRKRLLALRPEPESLGELTRALLPANLFISEFSIDGDQAILIATAGRDCASSAGHGQVELVRETDGWKVARMRLEFP